MVYIIAIVVFLIVLLICYQFYEPYVEIDSPFKGYSRSACLLSKPIKLKFNNKQMKIIKDYSELNKGDIVAISYHDEDIIFNVVGEFDCIGRTTVDIHLSIRSNGENATIWIDDVKTIMLLCPVEDKLELGDVWKREEDDFIKTYIIGEWHIGKLYAVYEEGSYNSVMTYSKERLIEEGYTLQEETLTPKKVTMEEVCKKFGEEVLIEKE